MAVKVPVANPTEASDNEYSPTFWTTKRTRSKPRAAKLGRLLLGDLWFRPNPFAGRSRLLRMVLEHDLTFGADLLSVSL